MGNVFSLFLNLNGTQKLPYGQARVFYFGINLHGGSTGVRMRRASSQKRLLGFRWNLLHKTFRVKFLSGQNYIDQFLNLEITRMSCFWSVELWSCDAQVPSYVKYLDILHDIMQWFHKNLETLFLKLEIHWKLAVPGILAALRMVKGRHECV